jgi:hypothetical protein
MTNPIRVALEKAWHESPSFLVDLPRGRVRQSLSLEEFAKGIHDFLRALPIILDRELHLPGMGDEPYPDFNALAQAVLAAAKEERE